MTGAFEPVIVVCGVRFRPDFRSFPTGWTTPGLRSEALHTPH
jgi:hypothetical protein